MSIDEGQPDGGIAPEILKSGRVIPVDVPVQHSTAIRLTHDSNDFMLLFQRATPFQLEFPDGRVVDAGKLETVAAVSMSPQGAKDLLIILSEVIKNYELEFGPLNTAFMRRRSESAKG